MSTATALELLESSEAVQVSPSEAARLDEADAEVLTERLRRALFAAAVAVEHAADLYAEAWARRADLALGYARWDLYVDARLGDLSALKIDQDRRLAMFDTMHAAGLSIRKSARLLGYSPSLLRKDLAHRARERALAAAAEDIVDAELVEEEPPALPAGPGPRTAVERVLAALATEGGRGLTRPEAARLLPDVPDVGAVLSELHRYGRVGRLAAAEASGTRWHDGRPFAVYLAVRAGWAPTAAPCDLTGGRELEGPGRRSRRRVA